MSTILVIAPHPDDETLGCGGTLLKHRQAGDDINWLIVTAMQEDQGFSAEVIDKRRTEIEQVSEAYGFSEVVELGYPCAQLDQLPLGELIQSIGNAIKQLAPDVLYLPWPGDTHSDHRVVFEVASSCCKWFRYPSVSRVLCYQTLSETEFGIDPRNPPFQPNVYVDISDQLEQKLDIMRLYASEMGDHPFPRSEAALRAQATLLGSTAGCMAAEAHMLLKERL